MTYVGVSSHSGAEHQDIPKTIVHLMRHVENARQVIIVVGVWLRCQRDVNLRSELLVIA